MKRRVLFFAAAIGFGWAVPPARGADRSDTLPQKGTKLIIRVTQGKQLWYFGGLSTPPDFTDGATEITLTAVGRTQGTFQWDVTAGADKVSLEGDVISLTKTNDNTVKVTSKKASGSVKGDVAIRLTFGTGKATRKLEVRAPKRLKALVPAGRIDFGRGDTCQVDGNSGWRSIYGYQILNQYDELVRSAGLNEKIGRKLDSESNNWPAFGFFGITATTGEFVDALCITGPIGIFSPQPEPPGDLVPGGSLSPRLIDKSAQDWRVGSVFEGQGVLVQTNEISRFIDHGRHTDVVTP